MIVLRRIRRRDKIPSPGGAGGTLASTGSGDLASSSRVPARATFDLEAWVLFSYGVHEEGGTSSAERPADETLPFRGFRVLPHSTLVGT